MKRCVRIICLTGLIVLLPGLVHAQNMADKIRSLQDVMETLYEDMIPLCSRLIGIGRGIAGFAATWYIASRVWGILPVRSRWIFIPCSVPLYLALRCWYFLRSSL